MFRRLNQRGLIQFVVLALVTLISVGVYLNQQSIRDWWVLRSYTPPAEIVELADEAALSGDGRRIFYVAKPELNASQEFNQNCNFEEKSLVLGCYSSGRIYVYNVDNQQLGGIEEVTAAHELLHAAYARLSGDERQHIDQLTAQALAELNDERINQVVEGYRRDDPSSVPNELHSILGSEVRHLPAELEAHYRRYFDDRLVVVDLAESYESVFTKLRRQLDSLKEDITALKSQISATEQELESRQQNLEEDSQRLNQLRQNGQIEKYNAGVPAYNSQVNTFNALIVDYKALVAKHNRLVEKFNSIALEQNQLVQSINSKFQPID